MKINYDNMMMNIINSLTEKKSILLHSCCGPCSSACIDRLKEYFDITVVYYNPNIEPIDEYIHRKNEQVRLLKEWNIKYLDCDYDFIFIDSSKSHYEKLLNNCIQNLNKNGIIMFDNVLYKGMVASDSLIVKRKKTIINNMRKFLKNVVNNKLFSTWLLPIGDGVMILRRNEENEKG